MIYIDWSPTTTEALSGPGTDLTTAVAGRIDISVEPKLLERATGSGWRKVFEGSNPDWTETYCIRYAAPVVGGWCCASFFRQKDDRWSWLYEPGPFRATPAGER